MKERGEKKGWKGKWLRREGNEGKAEENKQIKGDGREERNEGREGRSEEERKGRKEKEGRDKNARTVVR